MFYVVASEWCNDVMHYRKVKTLDTELHIVTNTLKSLELNESKVQEILHRYLEDRQESASVTEWLSAGLVMQVKISV